LILFAAGIEAILSTRIKSLTKLSSNTSFATARFCQIVNSKGTLECLT
jgi:hypothetical protein